MYVGGATVGTYIVGELSLACSGPRGYFDLLNMYVRHTFYYNKISTNYCFHLGGALYTLLPPRGSSRFLRVCGVADDVV